MRYDVVYKGCLRQTRQQVGTLQEAAEIIKNSKNDPNHYVIENSTTGISIVYADIWMEELREELQAIEEEHRTNTVPKLLETLRRDWTDEELVEAGFLKSDLIG